MSVAKKQMRTRFNDVCLKRDGYKCRVCGSGSGTQLDVPLEVHHISNRNYMPNGGYVKENGITLCGPCHYAAENLIYSENLLYRLIDSSYQKALDASNRLV